MVRVNKIKSLLGFEDKAFYSTLIKLCIPIIIQSGLSALLVLIDNIMIGKLGDINIAAVGFANQLYFLFSLASIGVTSGAGVLAAQYWGQKDRKNIRGVQGIAFICSLAVSLVFVSIGLFAGDIFIKFYNNDANVVLIGQKYLRISCFAYIFQALTLSQGAILKSTGNTLLPMISTGIAIPVNVFFNTVLIFGKLGFPALGAEGAAIGTVIAAVVDFLIVYSVSFFTKNTAYPTLSIFKSINLHTLKSFFRVGTPVFFNEMLWAGAVTIIMRFYGQMGIEQSSAMQIHSSIDKISFVVFIGIGTAAGIILGNLIGAGKRDLAQLYAKRILIIGLLMGIAIGIIVYLVSPLFLKLYNATDTTKEMALSVLRIFSCFIWLNVLNYINIVGVLRSGGDTVFATFLESGIQWLVTIPIAYVLAFVLNFPLYIVYMAFIPGDIMKLVFGLLRIKSAKWVHQL